MNMAYLLAWLYAFACTQAVEMPLYRWGVPIGWLRAGSLSLVTHPLVWFVIPPICYHAGLGYISMLVVAELFAWLAEALMLSMFGIGWRRALATALLVNGASFSLGLAGQLLFGFP